MKINNKYYFTTSKVFESKNLDVIYEFFRNKNIISQNNQDKLAEIAVASNNPDFILKIAHIIDNLDMDDETIVSRVDLLADATIKMNISDFILRFCEHVSGMSMEKRMEVIEAFINSESIYYHAYMNPNYQGIDSDEYREAQKNKEEMEWLRHPKSKYLLNFLQRVSWLIEDEIDILADGMVETKDINNIVKFFNKAQISYKKMKELEEYMLKNYNKDILGKILKKMNNTDLINKIYGSKDMLEKYLLDYEMYEKDNREFSSIQMQDYFINSSGIYNGGVRSTSGFIPKQEFRIIGHRKQTADELNAKYKFIDDNIQTVLNSMKKTKN